MSEICQLSKKNHCQTFKPNYCLRPKCLGQQFRSWVDKLHVSLESSQKTILLYPYILLSILFKAKLSLAIPIFGLPFNKQNWGWGQHGFSWTLEPKCCFRPAVKHNPSLPSSPVLFVCLCVFVFVFHSYDDITMSSEELQILTYVQHLCRLSSVRSLTCDTYTVTQDIRL